MSEIDNKINDGLPNPDLDGPINPLPDTQPEVQPDIEVPIELKKKAVNVEDLVFVRQYIDGKLEKEVPGVKVDNAVHADNADKATLADRATNADHSANADNAVRATNADKADEATHAGSADTATYAEKADLAVNAENATNAVHAETAGHAATADTTVTSYAESAGVAKKLEGFDFEVVKSDDDPIINGMLSLNGEHVKVLQAHHATEAFTAKNAETVNYLKLKIEDGLLKNDNSDIEVAKATNATLADSATNAEHADDSSLVGGHSINVGEDGQFRVDDAPVHVATANALYGYPIIPKWEKLTYKSTGWTEGETGPLLDYYVLQGIVDAHGDYVELKIGDRIQVVINPNSDEPRIFNGVVRKVHGVLTIVFPMLVEYYDYGESLHLSHMYFYNLEIYCAGVDKWSISYSKTTHSYGHPLSEAAEYVISDIDYTPLPQTITEVEIYRITI